MVGGGGGAGGEGEKLGFGGWWTGWGGEDAWLGGLTVRMGTRGDVVWVRRTGIGEKSGSSCSIVHGCDIEVDEIISLSVYRSIASNFTCNP